MEATATALHVELLKSLTVAEELLAKGQKKAAPLDGKKSLSDDAVIKIGTEFEQLGVDAKAAIKVCVEFVALRQVKMNGASEATKKEAAELGRRTHEAKRDVELLISKVKTRKDDAITSKAAKKQEALFKK